MALYLTALRGQHNGQEIPGFLWGVEAGQNIRQIVEHLRAESPWLGARTHGREVFTLAQPDNPEGDHLRDGREGAWPVDLRQPGSRGLLQLQVLAHLRERKVLVDLRSGFAAVKTQEQADGRLLVDGLELHLESLPAGDCLLWANPVRRVLDTRPKALEDAGHRSVDLWFPLEGVSLSAAHPKRNPQGWSVSVGRRARLVREGDPVAVVASEAPSTLTAQEVVTTLRSWFAGQVVSGLVLSSDPCDGDLLGFAEQALPDTQAAGLLENGERVALGDIFHAALGGHTAVRVPRLPPQTFHVTGVREELAAAVAQSLNERAAEWHGVALQFSTEPLPGSLEVSLDAKSPLATQPRSSRASGQAAALLLECVRRSGGSPWKIDLPGARWTLGIAQAFLYGKMHHLAFALVAPDGNLRAHAVVPFRFADLAEPSFAKGIARRLWETPPEDLVIHIDENLDPPPVFLSSLASKVPAWRLRKRSVPRAFGASTFAWLPPETLAVASRHVVALVEREDGIRPLALERVSGQDDPLRALEEILVSEFAWTPGRAERRHGPASLEWARGLLFQKERYQPLAQAGKAPGEKTS